MKRLKHLLWLVPLLLGLTALTLNMLARRAMNRDGEFHANLPVAIQVSSDDFEPLQDMPVSLSCTGDGISPHIRWTAGPEGTRSYVLIATDWDAPSPSFRLLVVPHWILFNMPVGLREISKNVRNEELTANSVVVGHAMGGTVGYVPPCPPVGRHRYQFRVYALDVEAIQPESNDRSNVLAAMDGHILAYGELIGFRAAE